MKLRGAVSKLKIENWKVKSDKAVSSFGFRFSLTPDLWPLTPSRGMTLIELLVVIVILTTLVGGVLPLVSPNNDSRKISEAARSMQTYFMQAQAEAARIGRPVGVGFRETAANSGVALEVFQLTVPKPYYGSSSLSRVGATALTIASAGGPKPELYQGSRYPQYVGAQLYSVNSRMTMEDPQTRVPIADPLPPKMFRVGDTVIAQGNRFVIIDDLRCPAAKDINSENWYVNPASNKPGFENQLFCVRLDEVQMQDEAQPLAPPPTGYSYAIHRQPMADSATRMTSSEAPLQLPSSIAIDLWASGIEADRLGNIEDVPPLEDTTIPGSPVQLPYTVGVMFSPNGGIESIWINGKKITELSKMFFLIGRQENGNPDPTLYTDWGGDGRTRMSDDELKERRSKVNWLNMDSRWLLVNANDGRISVSANASLDPRDDIDPRQLKDYIAEGIDLFKLLYPARMAKPGAVAAATIRLTRDFQIELAHGLAH
jgi:prepilin-type N-terminal cleavage/methylation domain-containing protein